MRYAFGGGALLAVLPWLDPWLLVPAAPVGRSLLARWTARRGRTLVALGSLEIQLASLVFYVSLNDRLYGGLTPQNGVSGRRSRGPTGSRRSFLDIRCRGAGVPAGVATAPGCSLARAASGSRGWSPSTATPSTRPSWRWRSAARSCSSRVFVAPYAVGPGSPWRTLGPALPCAVPLVAWGLRNAPRWVAALAAFATLAVSAWVLVALWSGSAAGWSAY